MLQPFIPDTAEKILDHIKIPYDQRNLESVGFILNGNIKIKFNELNNKESTKFNERGAKGSVISKD